MFIYVFINIVCDVISEKRLLSRLYLVVRLSYKNGLLENKPESNTGCR